MLSTSIWKWKWFILVESKKIDWQRAKLENAKGFLQILSKKQREALEEMAEKGLPASVVSLMYNAISIDIETRIEERTPGILLSTKEHTQYLISWGDRKE